ncbi:hypothetical protein [Chryseobacterium pennipullorum]|uniref:TolB-like 6-blade propeller-like n=1 Tax=Chryseobacterium pennipullorum TaxID=2258963 RepID=A0A3D9B5U0_9FLAO|nr:hypothetical protein [Chryseobacterium pennipullorum]REC48606.1 hypothetical protein DRF67_07245 [Chryseobacterium pennipullorum]
MSKVIYMFLLILLYSCNQSKKKSNLNGFDVSPDTKNIVFSYKVDSLYLVCTQPINNGRPSIIFKSSGNYVNPKYINNGKTIVALYYPHNDLVPEFHFYDTASHKINKRVKVDHGFISDYIFLPSNKIFYLQARTFQSYSKIAPKAYHDFDIYELDLNTLKSKRISNLNSYSMREILNVGKDSLLISRQGEPNESGLFLFNIKLDNKDQNVLNKIKIENDTLRNSTLYSNPVILSNNNILCASSYQMVRLDLKAKKEHPVLPSTGYHYNIIRNVKDLIFYQQNDNTNNIYYFNLGDKKINFLNITLGKKDVAK